MRKTRALYFRLGVFLLLAIAALVALALVLGTGVLFRKDIVLETYFDESIHGLDVGSKVMFRGVMVGNITRTGFTYVKYQQDLPPNQRKPYVLVQFNIRPQLIGNIGTSHDEIAAIIATQIERGLRVRQAAQGVTGLSYLELDYVNPKSNPELTLEWKPDNLYVPSTRSTYGRIFSATEDLMRRLGNVNLEGFVNNVNALALAVTSKVDQLPVERISGEISQLIGELRQTNQKLQKLVGDPSLQEVPKDLGAASRDAAVAAARFRRWSDSDELSKTVSQLQATLARLDRVVASKENDLATTLTNLRQITDNLRDLSENAKRYPSGVIFGEPPKREPAARGR